MNGQAVHYHFHVPVRQDYASTNITLWSVADELCTLGVTLTLLATPLGGTTLQQKAFTLIGIQVTQGLITACQYGAFKPVVETVSEVSAFVVRKAKETAGVVEQGGKIVVRCVGTLAFGAARLLKRVYTTATSLAAPPPQAEPVPTVDAPEADVTERMSRRHHPWLELVGVPVLLGLHWSYDTVAGAMDRARQINNALSLSAVLVAYQAQYPD